MDSMWSSHKIHMKHSSDFEQGQMHHNFLTLSSIRITSRIMSTSKWSIKTKLSSKSDIGITKIMKKKKKI